MLRLGLFDPDPESDELLFVGEPFLDTPANRVMLKAAVDRYNSNSATDPTISRCLAVFDAAKVRGRHRKRSGEHSSRASY
jgi:hypothetical protein